MTATLATRPAHLFLDKFGRWIITIPGTGTVQRIETRFRLDQGDDVEKVTGWIGETYPTLALRVHDRHGGRDDD